VAGEIIEIEKVPDLVFSQKMVGDGFAIIPEGSLIKAPVSGTVVQIFPTNHAFGILSDSGLEILVHIGIDTVELKGEGFTRLVSPGTKVASGDAIIEIDLEYLSTHAKSLITPVVITNKEVIKSMKINYGKNQTIAAIVEGGNK